MTYCQSIYKAVWKTGNAGWTTRLRSKGCTRCTGFCTALGPKRRPQRAAWTAIGVPMPRGGQDDIENPGIETRNEGKVFMRINFKRCIWVLTVAVGIGVGGGALQAVAQDHGQDSANNRTEQRDYSNNKTYQQGVREGRNDQARNRDHSKKRHFKKDEDQKAYESGYQQGHDRR